MTQTRSMDQSSHGFALSTALIPTTRHMSWLSPVVSQALWFCQALLMQSASVYPTFHDSVQLNGFIGGEAYVIKPRQTKERSPTSLLVEPPFGLNTSDINYDIPPRWRHLKHACGMYDLLCLVLLTNRLHPQVKTLVSIPDFRVLCHLRWPCIGRIYSGTRMDTIWADRQAFVLSADAPVLAHLQS